MSVSEGISYSEQMQREFELVDEHISELGKGISKEMAKSSGVQLVENIKSVEFRDLQNVTDVVFGRRLTTNLINILEKVATDETLRRIVEVNYPVDRFIRKAQERVSGMNAEIDKQELAIMLDVETAPRSHEYFQVLGNHEWRKEQAAKAAKKAAEAAAAKVAKAAKQAAELALTLSRALQSTEKAESKTSVDDSADSVPTPTPTRHPSPVREGEPADSNKADFLSKYTAMYLEEVDEHREKETHRLTFSAKKKKVEEETNRVVVLVAILDGIRSAINAIVNKLKAALASSHVLVRTKLSAMVTIDKTGELIVNPYENSNLAGMYHILKHEYHTATLVQFNRDFSDLLRNPFKEEDLLSDPLKAVNQIDKKIADWTLMAYGKFMTMDIFMVNILLMYLPVSPFKDRCVVCVTEFIQSKEADTKFSFGSDSGVQGMLIYQHLVEFMKVQHNSVGYLQFSGKGKPYSNPQNRGFNRAASGFESAAAVGELLASAISRDKGFLVKDVDSGTQYLYTATAAVCAICHGSPRSPHDEYKAHLGGFPQNRCVKTNCFKCNYFGHRAGNCQQHSSCYLKKST